VGGLGEAEGDLVGGDLVVAVNDGIDLVLNDLLVQGVEENLLVLLSVEGNSGGSSGDVGGEDL